ncbi:MAG: Ig-like domain-containing protein [Nitrososphaerota archaeon]
MVAKSFYRGAISIFLTLLLLSQAFHPNLSVYAANGNLVVTVLDFDGDKASTMPGTTGVVLYDSSYRYLSTKYIDSNSQVSWTNLASGTYFIEVYHRPGFGLDVNEFWGANQVNVPSGATNNYEFRRHSPIVWDIQYSSSSVEVGQTVTVTVVLKNLESGSMNCKTRLILDRDQSSPYDFDQTSSRVSIGGGATYSFSFTFMPSQSGTYYVYAVAYGFYVEDTTTDQWTWSKPLTVTYRYTVSISGLSSGSTNVYLNGVAKATLSNGQSYTFTGLSGTNKISVDSPIDVSSTTRYVCVPKEITVSSQGTYTFSYTTLYWLTMQANPSNAGTVSPSSGWYAAGMSVTISASPASGYSFLSWTGSGSGSYTGNSNPATITMNGPITQTANFQLQPFDFSISVSPSSRTVTAGQSTTYTVTVSLVSGAAQTVSLSLSGQHSSMSYNFNPSSGSPSFTSTLTVSTTSSTPSQTYTLTITGTGGGVVKQQQVTLIVQPVATVPSAPQNLMATAGDGRVTLTWSPPASDGGSTITNYKIYRRTSSTSQTLIATVGNVLTYTDTSVTNGVTYYYQVSAVNSVGEGSKSNEASATPTSTPPPDFSLSANPNSLSFTLPSSGSTPKTSTITITSINGFSSQVSLSTSWVGTTPSGVSCSFSKNPVTPPANGQDSSVLTVTVSSSASTGTFTLRVTGTGGSLTRSTDISVTISPTPSLSVQVSANPSSITTSQQSTITVTVTSGGSPVSGASVSLTTTGGSLNPASGTTDSTGKFTSTFSSSSTGTFTITATASKSGYTQGSDNTQVTVTSTPQPFDFSISVSPSSRTITAGQSTTYTVTVSLVSGAAQTVSLSLSGQHSSMSYSFNPSSGSPSFTSTLTVSTTSSTPAQTYTLTITGSGGGVVRQQQVTLIVNPPQQDTGILSIDTTPVKGEIFVNGQSWGIAPQSRTVNVGTYVVSFGSVSGYTAPASQTVTVYKGQTTSVTGVYTQIPQNKPPVAQLKLSSNVILSGEEVVFDAGASYDPEGTVLQYFFDFGDGSNSGWTSSPVVRHQYQNSLEQSLRSLIVSVKVRDSSGLESDIKRETIKVYGIILNIFNGYDDLGKLIAELLTGMGSSINAQVEVVVPDLDGITGVRLVLDGAVVRNQRVFNSRNYAFNVGSFKAFDKDWCIAIAKFAILNTISGLLALNARGIIVLSRIQIMYLEAAKEILKLSFDTLDIISASINPYAYLIEVHVIRNGKDITVWQGRERLPTIGDAIFEKSEEFGEFLIKNLNWLISILASPADLLIVDDQGRMTGAYYENGKFIGERNEIPYAIYSGHDKTPQVILIWNASSTYTLIVNGRGTGLYHLNCTLLNEGYYSTRTFVGEIEENVAHEYSMTIIKEDTGSKINFLSTVLNTDVVSPNPVIIGEPARVKLNISDPEGIALVNVSIFDAHRKWQNYTTKELGGLCFADLDTSKLAVGDAKLFVFAVDKEGFVSTKEYDFTVLGRLYILLDLLKNEYVSGEPITVSVLVKDHEGNNVDFATVKLKIADNIINATSLGEGKYRAQIKTSGLEGNQFIEITVTKLGYKPESDTLLFLIRPWWWPYLPYVMLAAIILVVSLLAYSLKKKAGKEVIVIDIEMLKEAKKLLDQGDYSKAVKYSANSLINELIEKFGLSKSLAHEEIINKVVEMRKDLDSEKLEYVINLGHDCEYGKYKASKEEAEKALKYTEELLKKLKT